MTCQEMTDFLMGYVEGELDPSVLATFERHLSACTSCREFLVEYKATIRVSRQACRMSEEQAPAVPEDLVSAIVESLRQTKS